MLVKVFNLRKLWPVFTTFSIRFPLFIPPLHTYKYIYIYSLTHTLSLSLSFLLSFLFPLALLESLRRLSFLSLTFFSIFLNLVVLSILYSFLSHFSFPTYIFRLLTFPFKLTPQRSALGHFSSSLAVFGRAALLAVCACVALYVCMNVCVHIYMQVCKLVFLCKLFRTRFYFLSSCSENHYSLTS